MDPHTYPGRPWPLSTLTIKHTDLYLRKSFKLLQKYLAPDTVVFLGDLFDGGREWSTDAFTGPENESLDKQWNKYGEVFWLREYERFGRIFIDPWLHDGKTPRKSQNGRRLLASLPGNHDLGFGMGIRLPVRKRFNAYFGEGNRIDMIGNHTFVSLDTVSLSANGQPSTAPGNTGVNVGKERVRKIWDSTETFLSTVKSEKARMVRRELRLQAGLPEYEPQNPAVLEILGSPSEPEDLTKRSKPETSIPSILLTHVPLYRPAGTPCGPHRERYPPSNNDAKAGDGSALDDRNALPVAAGVQYQTVLTPAISNEIIEKVGDVEFAFSGDDHDYCEVVHRGYTSRNGGVREITVKAMSWAAGIRKPGFLMLSLWNPIDDSGSPIAGGGGATITRTVETHLCLLPDQLSIFKSYLVLFLLTLIGLLFHAIAKAYGGYTTQSTSHNNLPIFKSEALRNKQEMMPASARSWTTPPSTSQRPRSPSRLVFDGLAARSSAARTRSTSPTSGYGLPVTEKDPRFFDRSSYQTPARGVEIYDGKKWNHVMMDAPKRRRDGKIHAVIQEWIANLAYVGLFAFGWYIWLLWGL